MRWREVVDVMLRKSPGDSRIHRLRIITLQESDYNQSNRLNIGQPVIHHLEDTNALPKMQYGSRPVKLCVSAVLNKQLTFKIARYKCTSIAYIENDATGCYNRITNPLVLLYLCKKGAPLQTILSLAETWEHTIHRIKTPYGISEQYYRNTLGYFLFRLSQGSTIGPVLWLICFTLICTSLSSTSPSIVLTSVNKAHTSRSKGCAFVDNSGLGCSQNSVCPSQPTDIVQDLHALAQEWEQLLYSTGGALNLQKCFWFLISWRWKNGQAVCHTTKSYPKELSMTSGSNTSETETIKRIEPTESYRTLGVWISPKDTITAPLANCVKPPLILIRI
jgi:hypothetical protein